MELTPSARAPIPEGALWNPELNAWELCRRDPNGERQGECRLFREDGTLLEVCHFERDVRNGPFLVYHPSGEVARRGTFTAGLVDGAFQAFSSDGHTTEVLRACCVPDNAWELRARYAHGSLLGEVFHDREGRPLLSTGALRPDPPAGVPPESELDETVERWVVGSSDDAGNRLGTWRSWTLDGRLAEVGEYQHGRLVSNRVYDTSTAEASLQPLAEFHYASNRAQDQAQDQVDDRADDAADSLRDEDVLHGDCRRRFAAEENPYADPRVREERGAFDRGRPVGPWTFLDAEGIALGTIDLGVPVDEDRADDSPAFAWRRGDALSAADRWALATQLRADRRLREALCVAARAAAVDNGGKGDNGDSDAARLAAFVSENTIALAPEVRLQRGVELSKSSEQTLTSALDALVTGVDPAAGFRTLAAVLDSAHPAALDFVNASLLLAPERRMTHLTRALIRLEQGDDRGALADAEAVEAESPEAASSLRAYLRPYFPDFSPRFSPEAGFWPAREAPEPLDDDARADGSPEDHQRQPAQLLPAVSQMIQIYATRLARMRAMIRERIGQRVPRPDWLPPDLSHLLPDGPVALRRLTIDAADYNQSATDDAELNESPETSEPNADLLRIDEEFALDASPRRSVADLLSAARADWSALGWLCWACGLDRVALPDRLAPPRAFSAAVTMSVARCFRAQDRMITGGVRGLSQGLPGFLWEGIDIDQMPNHFSRIAAAQYLEIRSMFLWLLLPDALSPFQSDLRDA